MKTAWCLMAVLLALPSCLSSPDEPDYDEVARFEEVLQLENPLAVLFSEKCCRCTECVEAEVLLGGMSKQLEEDLGVLVVRLQRPDLRPRFGVKHLPALLYVRRNKTAYFESKFELDSVYSWLQDNVEPATVDLNDDTFEHLTQAATGATTGDWLVMFHDGSCCKKRELIHLETAGVNLRNQVIVASVNTLDSPETAERFKITQCPTVIFFRHQKMYRFPLTDINTGALVKFAKTFYVNSKAEAVPPPRSGFDKLIEGVIKNLQGFQDDDWFPALKVMSYAAVVTSALLVCVILIPKKKPKKE